MFRHAQPHFENLTGTRGAYKPYSTTKHKVAAWDPTVSARP
jgi:NADH dehydrogenase (ubiquinone) 1 alpha subcomplex subunit 12